MKEGREIAGQAYLRLGPISIAETVRHGWGERIATISAEGTAGNSEPFFRHELAFQFAWWGAMFFGAGAAAATQRMPAVTINRFRGISLVGQDGLLFLPNGVELDYHISYLQPYRAGSLLRIEDGAVWRPDRQGAHISGQFMLGHTPPWSNYAHWVTDTLPIWVYYAANLKHRGVRLVVPQLSPVQSEALELLGIADADLLRADGQVLCFEELLVPSSISVWEPPAIFREAALHVVAKVTASSNLAPGLRLYFSRRDVQSRRLLNEEAVEAVLAAHGFQIICCSELSLAEQVARSAAAEIIVGCHGAAMANTVFASRGCRVIELFPEYCAQPAFRAIAARCGCQYGYIIGTSFDRENSRRDQNSWDADFVIDVEALRRALRLAMGLS